MRTLLLHRPDDWHVHFRDGTALQNTVPTTANHFARALAMPNVKPALTTLASVNAYHERLLNATPPNANFTPYMTFYLNEVVQPDELMQLHHHPHILGAKYYPQGATTHSEEGARSLAALYPLLEVMQDCDLVLQIHGEVTHGDIFEREGLFIKDVLLPLTRHFPKLRMVLEHISTRAAVEFVTTASPLITATITPHHLLYNRNDLLAGGLKPHYYCLPVLKHADDQRAVQKAAVSGNPKFFAGTDSAPHAIAHKENACCSAGIYSAPFALLLYAKIFDELNKLPQLDPFMSQFGAHFYHLPQTESLIELVERPQTIPPHLPFGRERVVPIAASTTLPWSPHEPT